MNAKTTTAKEPQRRIKIYDFKRPDKFSKDQIRTISIMHETMARLTTTSLSAQLRTLCHVHVASVDQLTYEEFIRSIPNPTTMAIVDMDPLKGSAVLEIDPEVTFAIIERLLGGPGENAAVTRDLTDIETSIMERMIVRVLGNLREAWSQVIDLSPRLGQIETNPQFAQIVPPTEMIVLVTLETKIGERGGMMNLCLPYLTIEPIIPKLSAQYWYSTVRRKPESTGIRTRAAMLPVDAAVCIEAERLSLRAISELAPGALIKLPRYGAGGAFLLAGEEPVLQLRRNNDVGAEELELSVIEPEEREPGDTEERQLDQTIRAAVESVAAEIRDGVPLLAAEIAKQVGTREQPAVSPKPVREGEAAAAVHSPPFGFLHAYDPSLIFTFIQHEHPQTIAFILVYAELEQAAAILSGLPADLQPDISRRMAAMGRISPEVLQEVERVLARRLATLSTEDDAAAGGIESVVEVLNLVRRSTEKNIVESLEKSDPELAEEIKKRLFVFEDIVLLDDRSVQMILRETDQPELAKALKAVDAKVQEKIIRNMSTKAADALKEAMAVMGPVRLKDVEESQQRIVAIIRKLEEQGEIVIARAGEDQLVV